MRKDKEKQEKIDEQLEAETLMGAEIEAATDCGPEDKKAEEKAEKKEAEKGCGCGCG